MIETNSQLISFILNNAVAIILLSLSLLRIVPPEWAGFWKFNDNDEAKGRAPKITILNLILTTLFDSVIRSFFLPLIAAFGLKNMTSLVIFMVVVFDIFVRHQISTQSVTLIAIGIIALYLDMLVETGKKIIFFGIIHWERKEN